METPATTESPEAAVQPAVETGLSPVLTVLAFLVLGALLWMIVRAQTDGTRVKYRSLVDPERMAVLHRTFRDAGQGAPAAIRAAGACRPGSTLPSHRSRVQRHRSMSRLLSVHLGPDNERGWSP